MDSFEKELKFSFLQEAMQLLAESESYFLEFEKKPQDESILEQIFRLAHNLKGSAGAVGFGELSQFTHEMETFLLKIKKREINPETSTVTLLLECNDHLKTWVHLLSGDFDVKLDSSALIHRLQTTAPKVLDVEADLSAENIMDLISSLHTPPKAKSPEVLASVAPDMPQLIDDSIRVALPRLERLTNDVGELVILQTVLNQHKMDFQSVLLQKTVAQLSKITKDIQEIAMSMRMQPLKLVFQKMQRIVRDTALDLRKEIQLVVDGEDTEVDKTVIEKISDPLVHLIRNAVDHGIESPMDRVKVGKVRKGRIYLRAFHVSGKIVIQIRDDGRGLDPAVIRKKAIEKRLISPEAVLTDKEAQNLIFLPGFSTKETADSISGRGVGMDVVKTNIEKVLRGEISIQSEPGTGTLFNIQLPLTLAIIEGLVVNSAQQKYIVPLFHVNESIRLMSAVVRKSSSLGYVLSLRGQEIPLYRLSSMLGQKTTTQKEIEQCMAIIARVGDRLVAVAVDDVTGQQQVVIKNLGAEMKNMRGFSGGAILGDGKPALILDLPELVLQMTHKVQKEARGVA